MKQDILEAYINQTINDYRVLSEGIIDVSKRRENSKLISNPTSNNAIIGKIIRSKKMDKNNKEVAQLLEERKLKLSYQTSGGKSIYTSPDLKLKGKEVRFISSYTMQCKDGYASIERANSLKSFLFMYDKLAANKEKFLDMVLADGVKYLYEDRKEKTDKNYSWIVKNWLKIKNFYIYTIYDGSSADMYCDVEVDISKLKGLEDYISKKSCTILYVDFNFSDQQFYVGQDILNDRTELWDIVPL